MTHKQAQTAAAFASFAAFLLAYIALLGREWRKPQNGGTCKFGLREVCCGADYVNCWDLDATDAWEASFWLFLFGVILTGSGASYSIWYALKEEAVEGQKDHPSVIPWHIMMRTIFSVVSTTFFTVTLALIGTMDASNTRENDQGSLGLSYWLALSATILMGFDTASQLAMIGITCNHRHKYTLVNVSDTSYYN